MAGRCPLAREVRAVLGQHRATCKHGGVPGSRAREHGSTSGPAATALPRGWPAGSSPATMALFRPRRQQPHARSAVPSVRHFDNAQLPYRWVPGLEVRRLPEAHYRSAPRLEVSHTFDWTPGPLWLYGAPGSGV